MRGKAVVSELSFGRAVRSAVAQGEVSVEDVLTLVALSMGNA